MKKLLLSAIATIVLSASVIAVEQTTKEKDLESLLNLQIDREEQLAIFNNFFEAVGITDTKKKEAMIDEFLTQEVRPKMAASFSALLSEQQLREIVAFHTSQTGKLYKQVSLDVMQQMNPIYYGFIQKLQAIAVAQEAAEAQAQAASAQPTAQTATPSVVAFESLTAGKNESEVLAIFENEIKNDFAVVKFSAEWCGPCKAYVPIFKEVAHEVKQLMVEGKSAGVKYITVDIDQSLAIANKFNIMSVPTTIFFKNGIAAETKTGMLKKQQLLDLITKLAK